MTSARRTLRTSGSVHLGVDLGTSSVKTVAVDASGATVAEAKRSYPLDTPRPGWAEQDPEAWVEATFATLREVAAAVAARPTARDGDGRARIAGVGLSGQMHSAVLVDAVGDPVRPAISWADGRSSRQAAAYAERLGTERLRTVFGNPVAAGFTGPSLLWVRAEEPETYARLRRVRLAKDHLRFRMTGDDATDPSDASATLLFDPFRLAWADAACERLGIDPALLPPVRPSDAVAGGISDAVAASTGLPPGTPVVVGAGDQAAAAVGVGLRDPGTLLASFGSGGQAFAPLAAPAADPRLRVHLFVHAVADRWHLEGAVQNVGLALDWVRRRLRLEWSDFVDAAAAAPAGADGVTFVPYLTGERSPWFDAKVRGGFSGLALAHEARHLARAALEGTTFALLEAIEACTEAGARVDHVVLTGGGASETVHRIVADVLDRPVARAEVRDASARGAAVLAGAPAAPLDLGRVAVPGPDAQAHRGAFVRYRARAREAAKRSG